MPDMVCDICVIGAGSGGLSVAAGAARLGARVVLIEKAAMGGDCLTVGCVPSKALIAAAGVAETARRAAGFGIHLAPPEVDFGAVMAQVRAVQAAIAPHDSQSRFEGLGVTVLREAARFTGPDTLEAGTARVRFKRAVVATGSRPVVPGITGLPDLSVLTNETVFALTDLPRRLLVVGGGPVGCELGQAFRRLGSEVVLVAPHLLPHDDPALSAVIADRLTAEGIDLRTGVRAAAARGRAGAVSLSLSDGSTVEGTHILLAVGRRPTVDGLGLDAAGVRYGPQGIEVDHRLRTGNHRIFAVGDVVAGGPRFTHAAGHQASIVVRNALFRLPTRHRNDLVPHVTFTDPELAQVGLTEAAARARFGDGIRVVEVPFADNDRARCEQRTEGLLKVVANGRGRVLGAGIVGPHAGDLIAPWLIAVRDRQRLSSLASLIVPYPTFGEVTRAAAAQYYTLMLFSDRTRALVRLLLRLP